MNLLKSNVLHSISELIEVNELISCYKPSVGRNMGNIFQVFHILEII